MSLSKTPTGEGLNQSALIGAGLLGVFLWRKEVLPKYMGIISIGAASFGLCSYVLNILKGDKKRSIDFCPVDTYYDEIASQVNKELSQEGNQSVIRRRTVSESEKFDPVAYLKRGTKISEDHKRKEPSCHGNFLKTCADRFIWKESSESGTEIDKITSEDPLELPLSEDEDEPSINEMEVKKKGITLNLGKTTKLDLLRDVIAESKGQSSQSIPGLLKEFDSIYSEAEKEISGIKWTKKGRSKKILGVGRSKAPKK